MAKDVSIDFVAEPTLAEFMRCNERIRAVRGPIGSAKSTTCAMELFRRMLEQEPNEDGIRKTQMAVVRNTASQLRMTCLVTILALFKGLARWKPSTAEVIFKFADVESTWILLPLDTPDNVRRLLSLDLTMAWVSEFRETTVVMVDDVFSRCGRYPSKLQGACTFYGLIMETNSFDEDSEWNDQLEINLPSNWGYFVQPPGVTVVTEENKEDYPYNFVGEILLTGENTQNLPLTYYSDQIESKGGIDAPWIRQYVMNEIAPSVSGEAVFKNSFYWGFHVPEHGVVPDRSLPICIGLDTGRNPAAIFTQIDPRGRMLVLGECYGANMGMEMFVEELMKPMLYQDRYRNIPVFAVIDPAGIAKGNMGEESVLMGLRRLGIPAVIAQTNNIDPRLRAVEKWLQRSVGGKGAIIFDYHECSTLLLAMQSKYRYKRKRDGELEEDRPDKTHPYSDLADGLQYACLGSAQNVRARALRQIMPQKKIVDPQASGWT